MKVSGNMSGHNSEKRLPVLAVCGVINDFFFFVKSLYVKGISLAGVDDQLIICFACEPSVKTEALHLRSN